MSDPIPAETLEAAGLTRLNPDKYDPSYIVDPDRLVALVAAATEADRLQADLAEAVSLLRGAHAAAVSRTGYHHSGPAAKVDPFLARLDSQPTEGAGHG